METTSQEESDRQFALMISKQLYMDDGDGYYADYGFSQESSSNKRKSVSCDEEYKPQGHKLTRKQSKSHKPHSNDSSTDPSLDSSSTAVDNKHANTETISKKLKTVTQGMNTGKFTNDEIALFREGLELYGRDWAMIEKHIVTRDSLAIRSHAQKYFIKLFRDNLPLPQKVIESGCGYTLSGKELDPESAAARPYLRGKHNNAISMHKIGVDKINLTADDSIENSLNSNLKIIPKKVKVQRKSVPLNESIADSEILMPVDRTDYAKSRPLRASVKSMSETIINFSGDYDDENAHRIIPCEKYSGIPGSGCVGAQPFKIKVNRRALLVMDLHSHLLSTEVIGFLAGSWNFKDKILEVDLAIPCRSVETNESEKVLDRHTNVELDPASEVEMRQLVEDKKLRVVGWYHSHPTFVPNPSVIDLLNQKNYQELFKSLDDQIINDLNENVLGRKSSEPFIGVIVGPYDSNLPKSISAINWFNVDYTEQGQNRPKSLTYDFCENGNGLEKQDCDNIIDLIKSCSNRVDRTKFQTGWRADRWETRFDKLKSSLLFHAYGNEKFTAEHDSLKNENIVSIQEILKVIESELERWPADE